MSIPGSGVCEKDTMFELSKSSKKGRVAVITSPGKAKKVAEYAETFWNGLTYLIILQGINFTNVRFHPRFPDTIETEHM